MLWSFLFMLSQDFLEFNNITVAIDIVYLLPVVFAAPEH